MKLGIVILSLFFASLVHAQTNPANTAGKGGKTADDGLNFTLGAHYSTGTMSNEDSSVESRSLNSLTGFGLVGYRMGRFNPFIVGEYSTSAQLTDPVEVSNTNTAGSGRLAGVGGAVTFGKIELMGSYYFIGNYALDKNDSSGRTLRYTTPTGLVATIGYKLTDHWKLIAVYRTVNFSKLATGDTVTIIKSNQFNHTNYGVGVSWSL